MPKRASTSARAGAARKGVRYLIRKWSACCLPHNPPCPEQDELQLAYERLQNASSHEVSRLRKQCDGLARELQDQAEQMAALRDELAARGGNAHVVERLRSKLRELEQQHREECAELHQSLSKHKKEVQISTPNIDTCTIANRWQH